MELLRFTTAGSVDDGKSTLIGRLLYDSKSIFEDQIEAVKKSSERKGLQHVDLSLLTDGLRSEREQGITIDVAYRYFANLDRFIWFYLWKWAKRRHAKKGHYWIVDKYFKRVGSRKWNLFGTFDNGKEIILVHASDTFIKRHVLINGKANPYSALWDKYFRQRYARKMAA